LASGREDNAAAAFQSTALTCSAKQKKNQSPSDDTWIGRIYVCLDEPTARQLPDVLNQGGKMCAGEAHFVKNGAYRRFWIH